MTVLATDGDVGDVLTFSLNTAEGQDGDLAAYINVMPDGVVKLRKDSDLDTFATVRGSVIVQDTKGKQLLQQ